MAGQICTKDGRVDRKTLVNEDVLDVGAARPRPCGSTPSAPLLHPAPGAQPHNQAWRTRNDSVLLDLACRSCSSSSACPGASTRTLAESSLLYALQESRQNAQHVKLASCTWQSQRPGQRPPAASPACARTCRSGAPTCGAACCCAPAQRRPRQRFCLSWRGQVRPPALAADDELALLLVHPDLRAGAGKKRE